MSGPDSDRPGRLVLRGGVVVTPGGETRADVLVEGQRIAAVGNITPADAQGADVLDATGCFLLPGGIDPHTHFELTTPAGHVGDDFYSGTLAALHGGTTSVLEHPGFGPEHCDIFHQINAYNALARGRAVVDYGLHLVFQPGQNWAADLPRAVALGHASGKAYTTYAGKLDDARLLDLFAAARRAGCLVTVHAENDAIMAWLREHGDFGGLGPADPLRHPLARPSWAEAEAVTRVLALARSAGAPVYIVHVSAKASLEAIRAARAAGQVVYAETCPQYLLLTDEAYARPDGAAFIMAPPLRTKDDAGALWDGLLDGTIDVLATDHCAFSLALKRELGRASVFDCPGGVPGVETRLPLLFTHGVVARGMGLARFAALTAGNAARIFGLAGKGALAPGMDADIVALDPALTRPLRPDALRQRADYCPFDGVARGWPRHVLLRGLTLIRDTAYLKREPQGRRLKTTDPGADYERPHASA